MAVVTCEYCGKRFVEGNGWIGRYDGRHFCCEAHLDKFYAEQEQREVEERQRDLALNGVTCAYCGKTISRYDPLVLMYGENEFYCNKTCESLKLDAIREAEEAREREAEAEAERKKKEAEEAEKKRKQKEHDDYRERLRNESVLVDGVFYNQEKTKLIECPRHLKKLTVIDGVTAIGEEAFKDCESLVSVELPASLKTIGEEAFKNCKSLKTVDLPEGVTEIGEYAFQDCESLEKMSLPGSLTELPDCVFSRCSSLETVKLSEGLQAISEYAFRECSALASLEIPKSVTTIGKYALSKTGLTSVTLPDSVTELPEGLFWQSDKLVSVTLPKTLTKIEKYAFSESGVKSIVIPKGITELSPYVFEDCDVLESVEFPEGMTEVVIYAAPSLKSVKIPDGVTKIEFNACNKLTENSFNIPESVKEIHFHGCDGMTSFTVPKTVTSINFQQMESLVSVSLAERIESIFFWSCPALKSIKIPSGVKSLTVNHCTALTSLSIPSSVESISAVGCTSLTSLTVAEGVKKIGSRDFANCTALKSVSIPKNTEVAEDAFKGCTSLRGRYAPGGGSSSSSWGNVFAGSLLGSVLGGILGKGANPRVAKIKKTVFGIAAAIIALVVVVKQVNVAKETRDYKARYEAQLAEWYAVATKHEPGEQMRSYANAHRRILINDGKTERYIELRNNSDTGFENARNRIAKLDAGGKLFPLSAEDAAFYKDALKGNGFLHDGETAQMVMTVKDYDYLGTWQKGNDLVGGACGYWSKHGKQRSSKMAVVQITMGENGTVKSIKDVSAK